MGALREKQSVINPYTHSYGDFEKYVGEQEGIHNGSKFFGRTYQDQVLRDLQEHPQKEFGWNSKISHHFWVSDPVKPRDIISYGSKEIVINDRYDKIEGKNRLSNFNEITTDTFLSSIAHLVEGANTKTEHYDMTKNGTVKGWDYHIVWTNIDLNPLFAQRYAEARNDGLVFNGQVDYSKTLTSFYALTKYGTLHALLLDKGTPNYELPTTNLASVDLSDEMNPKIHVYQINGDKWSDIERTTYQFADNGAIAARGPSATTSNNKTTSSSDIMAVTRVVSKVLTDGSSKIIDGTDDFDSGFAYFLRDIDEIREIGYSSKDALSLKKATFYGMTSDIWRLIAIKEFGGIYFDIDYALFDQLKINKSGKKSLFDLMQLTESIWGEEWCAGLCNAIIAADSPDNAVLLKTYELLKRNLGTDLNKIPEYIKYADNVLPIFFLTGPIMVSVAYAKIADQIENQVASSKLAHKDSGIAYNTNLQLQYGKLYSCDAKPREIDNDDIGIIGYDQWGGTWGGGNDAVAMWVA